MKLNVGLMMVAIAGLANTDVYVLNGSLLSNPTDYNQTIELVGRGKNLPVKLIIRERSPLNKYGRPDRAMAKDTLSEGVSLLVGDTKETTIGSVITPEQVRDTLITIAPLDRSSPLSGKYTLEETINSDTDETSFRLLVLDAKGRVRSTVDMKPAVTVDAK